MWRRQLPAWSPVTLRALVRGATVSGRSQRHRAFLQERVRAEYGATLMALTESGTAALALAILAAAPVGARPRVALPAWGCYDLMTAADIAGAEVMLYDLDVTTLAPSATSFADALRMRPTSTVVAHWFGLPALLSPLINETRRAGALLIEDAAQGVGGAIGPRPLATFGDFGILSFGRGKGRTGGVGGALLANTPAAASRLQHVMSRVGPAHAGKRGLVALAAQWAVGRPWLYIVPSSIPSLRLGETIYHPPAPLRAMPEWSAAAVCAVWDRSADACDRRRAAADAWARALAPFAIVRPYQAPAGTTPGWLRYPVWTRNPVALVDRDARRLGIMPGYPRTLADLPLAPGRLMNTGPWPGAADLATRLRTLPSHALVRSADRQAIVRLLERLERAS